MVNVLGILAQLDPKSEATTFFSEGIGLSIQRFAAVVALGVVAFGLFKAIGAALKGSIAQAGKSLIIAIAVAAVLFDLSLIGSFIGWCSTIWSNIISTGDKTIQ